MRTTHTLALMAVSESTYNEIKAKLVEAGYDHAILETPKRVGVEDGPMLDMTGIGIVQQEQP